MNLLIIRVHLYCESEIVFEQTCRLLPKHIKRTNVQTKGIGTASIVAIASLCERSNPF